jgi:hypothetical protein
MASQIPWCNYPWFLYWGYLKRMIYGGVKTVMAAVDHSTQSTISYLSLYLLYYNSCLIEFHKRRFTFFFFIRLCIVVTKIEYFKHRNILLTRVVTPWNTVLNISLSLSSFLQPMLIVRKLILQDEEAPVNIYHAVMHLWRRDLALNFVEVEIIRLGKMLKCVSTLLETQSDATFHVLECYSEHDRQQTVSESRLTLNDPIIQ